MKFTFNKIIIKHYLSIYQNQKELAYYNYSQKLEEFDTEKNYYFIIGEGKRIYLLK